MNELRILTKDIRNKFNFLNGVKIKVINKNGITRARFKYTIRNNRITNKRYIIYLYLKQLKNKRNTPRYIKLLGKTKSFKEFYGKVLLHEICHIRQFKKGVFGNTTNLSWKKHDNHKDEKQANLFAIRHFNNIKPLLTR